MAKTTYYMLVRQSDDLILKVATSDIWTGTVFDISENEVNSATFDSSDTGDSPDVITPAAKPWEDGTFDDSPITYTPPTKYYVESSWSGNGTLNSDGVYELTANGTNTATLTLTKKDKVGDQTPGSGTEEYYYQASGIGADVASITLSSGTGSVTFTPDNGDKGTVLINIYPKGGHSVYFEGSALLCLT